MSLQALKEVANSVSAQEKETAEPLLAVKLCGGTVEDRMVSYGPSDFLQAKGHLLAGEQGKTERPSFHLAVVLLGQLELHAEERKVREDSLAKQLSDYEAGSTSVKMVKTKNEDQSCALPNVCNLNVVHITVLQACPQRKPALVPLSNGNLKDMSRPTPQKSRGAPSLCLGAKAVSNCELWF